MYVERATANPFGVMAAVSPQYEYLFFIFLLRKKQVTLSFYFMVLINMKHFLPVWAVCCLCCCNGSVRQAVTTDAYPDIFPDYREVTIPVNIAPLNFGLRDSSERMEVRFLRDGQTALTCKGRKSTGIKESAWRNMLRQAAGTALQVQVYSRRAGRWNAYRPFNIHVANDSIDPYIAYRLIEPGYEQWDRMGIYQRNLSAFDESAIIVNTLTGWNCVNCHSFHNYHPRRMMFHARAGKNSGTFLFANDTMKRINTKTEHAESAATYPMWHPSGDYIAFSINSPRQAFHLLPGKKIEVYDLESDLAVWDVKNGAVIRDARFTTKDVWETFPAWSPDGKWLYYCVAEKKNMPFESKQLMYALCRVEFDAANGRFGHQVDTVIRPATSGISVSLPRISPDGRYLLYTASAYGTMPHCRSETNLEMIDLNDGSPVDIQLINSAESDSYHSWSSNGRWIVVGSRRMDGLYTRLFFAYFDPAGQIHKPFLLPQRNPEDNTLHLKSYNVPEFVKGKVELNPYEVTRTLNGEMVNLNEIIHEN